MGTVRRRQGSGSAVAREPGAMGSEAARLLDAVDFAARKHRWQRRKDPEETPYINHPIGESDARSVRVATGKGRGGRPQRPQRAAAAFAQARGEDAGHPSTSQRRDSGIVVGPDSPLPAPLGVARILTHEAGITDIAVLQVTSYPGWGTPPAHRG